MVRNGKPQSRAKTIWENCEVKCDHSPRRVPGSANDSRSWPTASRQVIGGEAWAPIGESRIPASTATPTSTPIAAAPR